MFTALAVCGIRAPASLRNPSRNTTSPAPRRGEEENLKTQRKSHTSALFDQHKGQIIEAFDKYRESGNAMELYLPLFEFARFRFQTVEFEFGDRAEGADDYAQELAIGIVTGEALQNFTGDANAFYGWLVKACKNAGAEFFSDSLKHRNKFGSLTTVTESGEEIENPELYWGDADGGNVWYPRELRTLTGLDKKVCDLLAGRFSQKSIAQILGMTPSAVSQRLSRLQKRLARERAQATN